MSIPPWDPTQVASLNPTQPGSQTTATSIGLGEMYVSASAGGQSDKAYLTVATSPGVIACQPDANPGTPDCDPGAFNVCRNAVISATFDQEMDRTTLNSSTVILEIREPGHHRNGSLFLVEFPVRISSPRIIKFKPRFSLRQLPR